MKSIYPFIIESLSRAGHVLRVVRFPSFAGVMLMGAASGEADERAERVAGNRAAVNAYFSHQIERINEAPLTGLETLAEWEERRETYRDQLRYMLGLDSLAETTQLNPRITGSLEQDGFTVHKLHFQSLPGLYVTANLYVPHGLEEPAPAVLYLCGHVSRVRDGVSLGNKAAYQHHPAWFARHGYVALIIDTIQHGEFRGMHLGTRSEGMWWWNSRGYTPAGVEAFNAMRAIDYLATRDDVDTDRIGVTGHSGGGIGALYLAALDQRVAVAAPVSGVVDLRKHVGDQLLSRHCDCNYFPNAYRFDFDRIVALIAPRPLLLAGADRDPIFPLDGVRRIHRQVTHVYDLYNGAENFGLSVVPGGHEDTQLLRVPVFSWFNAHLKGDRSPINRPAETFIDDAELRVFDELPEDQMVTGIHHSFVPAAEVPVPDTVSAWHRQRDSFREQLDEVTFGNQARSGEPAEVMDVFRFAVDGIELRAVDITVQPHVKLRLYAVRRANAEVEGLVLSLLNEEDWLRFLGAAKAFYPDAFTEELAMYPDIEAAPDRAGRSFETIKETGNAHLFLAPRGIGLSRWADPDSAEATHIRRSFALLGQTLDGQRVLDVLRTIETVRSYPGVEGLPLTLRGRGELGGVVLYAAVLDGGGDSVELEDLPATHGEGPELMNVLRYMDIPQALAMALEQSPVTLTGVRNPDTWQYARSIADLIGRSTALRLEE